MDSSVRTLLDLLERPEFLTGLLGGVAAWLITNMFSSSRRGWGVAVTAATILGVNVAVSRRLSLAVGVMLLYFGGTLLDRAGKAQAPGRFTWVAIIVGALIVAYRGGMPDIAWVQFIAPAITVTIGYWMRHWFDLPQRRLLGPLFFITAFGIWTTIPDTDAARVLLGASTVLSVATLTANGLRMSAAGSIPLAGLTVWIAANGGGGRHGSIVGAWACFGMILALPLLIDRVGGLPNWLVLTAHAIWVLVSSRVLGRWDAAAPVTLAVVILASLTFLLIRAYVESARYQRHELDSS